MNIRKLKKIQGKKLFRRVMWLLYRKPIQVEFTITDLSSVVLVPTRYPSEGDLLVTGVGHRPTVNPEFIISHAAEFGVITNMPGFFYHPNPKLLQVVNLEELTDKERFTIMLNQGNYMVNPDEYLPEILNDMRCACENANIPTHRLPGAVIPQYGSVPFQMERAPLPQWTDL